MNTNDFVIAMRPVNGIVKNSVGVIKSVSQEGILAYFIGKNEEVRVPFGSIAVIDRTYAKMIDKIVVHP